MMNLKINFPGLSYQFYGHFTKYYIINHLLLQYMACLCWLPVISFHAQFKMLLITYKAPNS